MQQLLVSAGIVAIFGAILGGGLKAFNIELPLIQTLARQVILAGVGIGLFVVGLFLGPEGPKGKEKPVQTRAAWASQVNPECRKVLDAAGAMSAQFSPAEAAVRGGNVAPMLELANMAIPDFIKILNTFDTHVKEIEPPTGDAGRVSTMLSALQQVALRFDTIASHQRKVAEEAQAALQEAQQTAAQGGTVDPEQVVLRLKNETAGDTTAIQGAKAAGNLYITSFRDEANELQASECARLRALETPPSGA